MNQLLGSMLFLPIENVVNQLLQEDPHIAASLAPFAGKSLQVRVQNPDLDFTVLFDDCRIGIKALDSDTLMLTPDASISGPASEFLQLLQNPDKQALANRALTISGDAVLIQELFRAVQTLDLDWQDHLAPVLGDVATHQLGQLLGGARRWGQGVGQELRADISDYLTEESGLLATRHQVNALATALDSLKLRVDRAAARMDLLNSRLDQLSD